MTQHHVTLVFEDHRSLAIEAGEQETIHAAALRQKIRLITDCLEGACGTCKAMCTQGAFELGDYSDEALSSDERDQGFTLCCQMRARSDCVIELPYPATQALVRVPVREHGARVTAIEQVAAGVVQLDVERSDDAPFAYLAGQYVNLQVPGTTSVRSYSMARAPMNSSDAARMLRFYVKVLDSGAMSEYVTQRAKPGDAIRFHGPFGHFYLRAPHRPILMVAGGTGLGPMLAMLEQLAAMGGRNQVRLLYGVNKDDEFFALDQLEALHQRGIELVVERIPVTSSPSWSGPVGHVTTLLRTELLAGGARDVYLCGPPPMVEAAERWLSGHGVPRNRIHAEKFIPA
jgi:ferredoxin-NADP reductase/ferredoxin